MEKWPIPGLAQGKYESRMLCARKAKMCSKTTKDRWSEDRSRSEGLLADWEQSDIRKEDSDGLNKQHWGGGRDQ